MRVNCDQKTPKFFSRDLFGYSNKLQLSYSEAATRQQTCRKTAISRITRDIANGYLVRQRTTYKCHRYKKLLDGKNIYHLTDKGKAVLGRLPPESPKEKTPQKDVDLLAALKEWMLTPQHNQKNIFQKVSQLCPIWWVKTPELLKKTLLLLKRKIQKGYRVHSPLCWISSALKESGVGFHRKKAKEYSLKILSYENRASNRTSFVQPEKNFGAGFREGQASRLSRSPLQNKQGETKPLVTSSPFSSPYIAEGFGNLSSLAQKGLNVSEEALLPLLRKGFGHLSQAAQVLLRVEKSQEINNFNAFLNWLISLKEPFEALKPKQIPQEKRLEWAKQKLTALKEHCVFLKSPNQAHPRSDSSKLYVYFGISKKTPMKSLFRVCFFDRGLHSSWQEACFSLGDLDFQQTFSKIFFKKRGVLT